MYFFVAIHDNSLHGYEQNKAFTKHIVDSMMQSFEEKLELEISIPLKTLCDVLGFREFDDCSLNFHLADSTIKKHMGRINDVLIFANRNYVPVDSLFLI